MSDYGYGSPSPDGVDAGFGSPSDVIDSGFGSPSGFAGLLPAVAPLLGGAITDDGGTRVYLTAAWDKATTYRVRLVDSAGDLHPAIGYCYSGVPGRGPDCAQKLNGTELPFIAPPVPPGVYGVRVYAGPTFTDSVDTVNALVIRRRQHHASVYRLRDMYPSWYEGPGPRALVDDYRPEA